MITLDFETRSEADLKRSGSYVYAAHPSTTALCLAWAYDDEPRTHLWHPAYPAAGLPEEGAEDLAELHDRVMLGEEMEAHNAFFERCVWALAMSARHGWPGVEDWQWRCSAAKAASYALPRSLDGATSALRLPVHKDMAGNRLVLKLTKPRKPRKAELRAAGCASAEEFYARHGAIWHEKRAELERIFEYCRSDVLAERALSRSLRDLPPEEVATWRLDQAINLRGVYCDRAMATKAVSLVEEEREDANREVDALTGGDVTSTTKREELLNWAAVEGHDLENTQAATIDAILGEDDLDPTYRRVLEVWRSVNRTSVKKYDAMLDRMAGDDRIRDILLYHGASTGRWAGRGIQPQNFPRGTIEDMEAACADILALDRGTLRLLYGDVMELLSHALRGALCAAPGHDLLVADYSAVEARGTFWIADHTRGLQLFRDMDAGKMPGEDIYTWQASEILGRRVTKKDKHERQAWGKIPVLGCGYQMGPDKLITYAAGMGVEIEYDDAKRIVDGYRETNWPVKKFWYDVERAAILAVERGPGAPPVECGRTLWAVRGRFLHCRLPSGRMLSYCDPWVDLEPTPWDEMRPKLKFMGIDTYTKKWSRQSTYGGKLTENIVQALCRDLMRDGMLAAEARGYPIVLTVHDEVVSEVKEGRKSLAEFESIVGAAPKWADGFPVVAEGWRGKRYRKG